MGTGVHYICAQNVYFIVNEIIIPIQYNNAVLGVHYCLHVLLTCAACITDLSFFFFFFFFFLHLVRSSL